MAVVKFHEKNQAVYFGLQTAEGSPVNTNALGSTTAIACTAVTADPTRDTGSFQYLGDSLSRDEYTYEKDTYIDLQIETFQQILSDMSSAINPDTASLWKLFQICGGRVDVDATTKEVIVTNIAESPDYGTADVRLSSPDDATNDKLYKFTDLRGTVDVNASVGEVPTLKFALKGNATDPVSAAKQTANFGFQTTRVAPSVLKDTIQIAQIALLDDVFTNAVAATPTGTYADYRVKISFAATHSIPVGQIVAIQVAGITNAGLIEKLNGTFIGISTGTDTMEYYAKGVTGSGSLTGTITVKKGDTAVKTFCFSTLDAPNFFGFDYQRFLTGCLTGFAKGATPTDVTVSMLEDKVGGDSFDPDANVTKFFGVYLQFGNSTAGQKVGYLWDKLQIANVKQGKIATYLARDVSLRNTGSSFILYK